ncbi:MAG: hypothetical protein MI743_13415, partial [Sneathiellales bacterium]|nr:hypothetical protein [Sneathiellales bacterium]
MADWNIILSFVTFLPLVGVVLILLTGGKKEEADRNAKSVALLTTVVTFAVSLIIWYLFDNSQAGFQLVEEAEWLGGSINYKMGVDGISMLFIILTTFLMPLCILASWTAITERVREYMIAFLFMETLMIGVFCALDMVLFYLFFEAGLIP